MTVGGQGEADATRSFLDGPCARGLAVLCFLLALTALGYLHREALIPGLAQEEAADDPVIACIQARTVEVQRMQRDGLITGQQAATFTARLEGVCRAQTGRPASAVPAPQLPMR